MTGLSGYSPDRRLRVTLADPGSFLHWLHTWLLTTPHADPTSLQTAITLEPTIRFFIEVRIPSPTPQQLATIPSNGWCGYLTHRVLTDPTLSLPISANASTNLALCRYLDQLTTSPTTPRPLHDARHWLATHDFQSALPQPLWFELDWVPQLPDAGTPWHISRLPQGRNQLPPNYGPDANAFPPPSTAPPYPGHNSMRLSFIHEPPGSTASTTAPSPSLTA